MTFEESYRPRKSHLYNVVNGRDSYSSSTGTANTSASYGTSRASRGTASTGNETIVAKAKPDSSSSSSGLGGSSSKAPSSSYLARLAGDATAASGKSSSSGLYYNPISSGGGVRSNLESRLKWMETAFKEGSQAQGGQPYNLKATLGSARRRVMVLLREQMTAQMRAEIEALDKELAEINDHT